MGSARRLSWNYSRKVMYDTCQRSVFFEYFSRGEPEHFRAQFLRKLTTHEALAEKIVQETIALALESFYLNGSIRRVLKDIAVHKFIKASESSRWNGQRLRSEREPDAKTATLFCDAYGYDSGESHRRGIELVETCMDNFEACEHWEEIRKTDIFFWGEINPPLKRIPSFQFHDEHIKHVEVSYSPDLIIRDRGLLHLVDWRVDDADAPDFRLLSYALGFIKKAQVPIQNIRVQYVPLAFPMRWSPQAIVEGEVAHVEQEIRFQIELEVQRCCLGRDAAGYRAYFTDREDYPADPSVTKCSACKFLQICREGREHIQEILGE